MAAEGSEATCGRLCTCLLTSVQQDQAAMRELSKPGSATSPETKQAILSAWSRCSESLPDLPHRKYNPKALRAQLGTKVDAVTDHSPAPTPPAQLFDKVMYPAPLGANVAYVSPVKRGKPRAAILWLAGGFDWGLGDSFWLPAPRSNDQSARAFREAGLVLMLPALRGSNENPGHNECFFGEVDDVLAAAEFLARRPDVDPNRIYLGGHSTGGTLALLVAQSSQRFRAVFAFGPVADPRQYGEDGCLPPGLPTLELAVRAPLTGMDLLTTPTFIVEGLVQGNVDATAELRANARSSVQFIDVPGATHFSVLSPGSEVIARAILGDTGDTGDSARLTISAQEIVTALARAK